jgi:hypothetical protein
MEHFVTLFDSLYAPQGLALHMSMDRHVKNYVLWILCVDDEIYELFLALNFSNVRLLQLSKLETDELLRIKTSRTKGEYCWTLTPFAPRFVFEADDCVQRVTYLDADVWFRKTPSLIFEEFDNSHKHVLITDHAYSPEFDQSTTSGQYCVQFMTFTRNGSDIVRAWWEKRCIEWCYDRFEDGKFGDQKYLDLFTQYFPSEVHVLNNVELILAPWNATRFPFGKSIVWHFHSLRIVKVLSGFTLFQGHYPIPETTFRNIYIPYIHDIRNSITLLTEHNFPIKNQLPNYYTNQVKTFLRFIFKIPHKILKNWRRFNL